MELNNCQFLKPLVLPAALKQLVYQATNRLLLAALEEYGDSGTTQKKDVKEDTSQNATINFKTLYVYYKHFYCK